MLNRYNNTGHHSDHSRHNRPSLDGHGHHPSNWRPSNRPSFEHRPSPGGYSSSSLVGSRPPFNAHAHRSSPGGQSYSYRRDSGNSSRGTPGQGLRQPFPSQQLDAATRIVESVERGNASRDDARREESWFHYDIAARGIGVINGNSPPYEINPSSPLAHRHQPPPPQRPYTAGSILLPIHDQYGNVNNFTTAFGLGEAVTYLRNDMNLNTSEYEPAVLRLANDLSQLLKVDGDNMLHADRLADPSEREAVKAALEDVLFESNNFGDYCLEVRREVFQLCCAVIFRSNPRQRHQTFRRHVGFVNRLNDQASNLKNENNWLRRQLGIKDETLAENNQRLVDQAAELEEKERQLAEKGHQLAEKDRQLVEKDLEAKQRAVEVVKYHAVFKSLKGPPPEGASDEGKMVETEQSRKRKRTEEDPDDKRTDEDPLDENDPIVSNCPVNRASWPF